VGNRQYLLVCVFNDVHVASTGPGPGKKKSK
jgi:hypothetical protein